MSTYCVGAGPAAPPQRLWSVAVTCSNWPKLGFGCGFPMLSRKGSTPKVVQLLEILSLEEFNLVSSLESPKTCHLDS